MRTLAASILIFVLLGAGAAPAQDAKEHAGKKQRPKETPTVAERLVKELKALVAREGAKPDYDRELVEALEGLVARFEKEAKEERERRRVSLEDLSEEERAKLKAEVRREMEAERRQRGGDRVNEWMRRALERAYEGVELKDQQREKTDAILSEFYQKAAAAWRDGDTKALKNLRNDTERRLRKVVGATKAKKIINNMNKLLGGPRGVR